MGEEEREKVMSFVDRAEEKGGEKTAWGVFLTNALPLGEALISYPLFLFVLDISIELFSKEIS